MSRLGTSEIIIILVIVLLIFGPGRIVKVAEEMGKGIKVFKKNVSEEEKTEDEETKEKESGSETK
jgi:sec-independent protein translocase protein TatA